MRKVIYPLLALGALILLWSISVEVFDISKFILPSPSAVAKVLVSDFYSLSTALLATLKITFIALLAAVASGVSLALAFS
ncbi:MAG: ABC transporter permease, partial [Alphaproteobacteria bacterium]|nr:ABC transporter permease [Alphaproteobacteria bacterium]